jgi:PKD domain
MKKALLLLFLPCLTMLLLGSKCHQPEPPDLPTILPCFNIVEDTFRNPRLPVQFQNCSQGAASYLWDFGDGTTSAEQSPAHTYTTVGYFTVKLTGFQGDYQEDFTKEIRVDYPRFKKFRVLHIPVMDKHGVPHNYDGSGLDLVFQIFRGTDNFPTFSRVANDVFLPYEFEITSDQSIDAYYWYIYLKCVGATTIDTIVQVSRHFEDLIVSPVDHLAWDSVEVETIMEGTR